jgi:hypothetical protein
MTMASSALSIFSGIAAAAAGLAGDKVPKSGAIPGLDLSSILPALLSKIGGGGSGGSNLLGTIGTIASVASQTGLLKGGAGNLASLAGSLLSAKSGTTAKTTAKTGVAGLAAAIMGGSGSGTDLGKIATMAGTLAKGASTTKDLTGIASSLGKTLSSSFGVNLNGGSSVVKALGSVVEKGDEGNLFTSILKGLV